MVLHGYIGHPQGVPLPEQGANQEPSDKTSDKTSNKDLSATEKTIVSMIESNPSVTHKEMAVQLNLIEVGICCHTDKLKTKGILQRIGGKKSGRWKVSK